MANLHKGDYPIARIVTFGDFPVCVTNDGTTILVLQWDYAAWTAAAARFSEKVHNFAAARRRNGKVVVAVSGDVSPLLRQKMQAAADNDKDRAAILQGLFPPATGGNG